MTLLRLLLPLLLLNTSMESSPQEILMQYLDTAANNNAGLKVQFNTYMASLEKVHQVSALPDPMVTFGYFIQPIETRSGPQQAKISVSQMFPWFGTLDAGANAMALKAKANYQDFMESKSKLFYDVKSTFYNIYFANQAIVITKQNLAILSSLKILTESKIESGTASLADAYVVEMEINDLQNQLAHFYDDANILAVKFNQLLNREIHTKIHLPDTLKTDSLGNKNSELKEILAGNHALITCDYQLEELRYHQQLASKARLPNFNIGLDYYFIGTSKTTTNSRGGDAIMFPMIGISMPLSRGRNRAKVQETRFLHEAKSNEKTDKTNTAIVLFEETWKAYLDARRRILHFQKQELLASRTLTILETKYANNNSNFQEILEMEQKLLKYELQLHKAITDKAFAVAFIHYLKGE